MTMTKGTAWIQDRLEYHLGPTSSKRLKAWVRHIQGPANLNMQETGNYAVVAQFLPIDTSITMLGDEFLMVAGQNDKRLYDVKLVTFDPNIKRCRIVHPLEITEQIDLMYQEDLISPAVKEQLAPNPFYRVALYCAYHYGVLPNQVGAGNLKKMPPPPDPLTLITKKKRRRIVTRETQVTQEMEAYDEFHEED